MRSTYRPFDQVLQLLVFAAIAAALIFAVTMIFGVMQ